MMMPSTFEDNRASIDVQSQYLNVTHWSRYRLGLLTLFGSAY